MLKIKIFLIVMLLAVFVSVYAGYQAINNLIKSQDWVSHTHEVENNIEHFTSLLKDAETAQRGYLLTNDLSYLEPYTNTHEKTLNSLNQLKKLTVDNSEQQKKIKQIEASVKEKLTELDDTINLTKAGNRTSALEIVLTDRGKKIMDDIRLLTDKMIKEEERLLVIRQRNADSAINTALFVASLGSVLVAIFLGVIAIFFMRDNRKKLIKTELQKEQLQRALYEAAEQKKVMDLHSIVTQTDKRGTITYANTLFSKISGYTNSELIGQNHRILNSSFHPPKFFKQMWATISKGEVWHGEVCNKSKSGELYWVNTTIAPQLDKSGRVFQYTAVRTDITHIKETEKLLRHSQKMEAIGELTGGIAHDFNNLLGIIIGNLELAMFKAGDDTKLQKQLGSAMSAAFRGADITRRLLNFSRQSDESFKPESLVEVLEEFEELIAKSMTASISVDIRVADDAWKVDINSGDFQDAMINLCLNARDVMHSGGTLLIQINNTTLEDKVVTQHLQIDAGEYVKVKVSDSGTGMAQETIDKIFDPFFSTKEKGKGTGLGLAMVFGFVKRSNGMITVNSVEGEGTTFTMYLPRSVSLLKETVNQVKTEPPKGNETVLIVDDEEELITFSKNALEPLGYTTLCASNGEEAMKILVTNDSVDIVFSDIVMPGGINGFDIAKAVTETKSNTKILLTSGFTGNLNPTSTEKVWLENLLAKPYRTLELAEAIRKTLDE